VCVVCWGGVGWENVLGSKEVNKLIYIEPFRDLIQASHSFSVPHTPSNQTLYLLSCLNSFERAL
jgi:hypothetical protein